MTRICFELQVKPGHLDAYRASHAAVWPEMLEALESTGWRNYSIFTRPDGLVIGYFETDDLAASLAGMAATEVNARWQEAMADHFIDSALPADQTFEYLSEAFNLGDQLTRTRTAPA
ncbi:L-rhamnose mutarotase [Glaciihabitans tibetensis]|uniref:L-rhamnose mutarotase n=1 Tax=Glaciihabitans tibetensis TaxID=1266600 RepID=A0A2T0V9U2_9MICO|nr:L-rhamnose mutarotase [Glaciihabitans tibetensis]PRY66923.1 L-rhamnose mutarotase [Glaciihabitans tibetensis]